MSIPAIAVLWWWFVFNNSVFSGLSGNTCQPMSTYDPSSNRHLISPSALAHPISPVRACWAGDQQRGGRGGLRPCPSLSILSCVAAKGSPGSLNPQYPRNTPHNLVVSVVIHCARNSGGHALGGPKESSFSPMSGPASSSARAV